MANGHPLFSERNCFEFTRLVRPAFWILRAAALCVRAEDCNGASPAAWPDGGLRSRNRIG